MSDLMYPVFDSSAASTSEPAKSFEYEGGRAESCSDERENTGSGLEGPGLVA